MNQMVVFFIAFALGAVFVLQLLLGSVQLGLTSKSMPGASPLQSSCVIDRSRLQILGQEQERRSHQRQPQTAAAAACAPSSVS